ncbi:MAG: FAD-dependent oxidoreductase, partial [Planctomycetes bacterium]|nr:FAD-dependent oxidoreductase [Planctomycetota bacterium]
MVSAHLGDRNWDLLVVGGGILGAWCALDARLRGLNVALIEAGDWGCGTSQSSSKLIHGGLRYLERFELSLVRGALAERATLTRIAPHLVRPLRFQIPLRR